jgi:hypothetical protein
MASRLLNLCKTIDKRLWGFENPLRQFPTLSQEILKKLEERKLTIDKLKEMDAKEIGMSLECFKDKNENNVFCYIVGGLG